MNKFVTVINILKKNRNELKIAFALSFAQSRVSHLFPDGIYLKIQYWLFIGKKLNINNPQTFNEKLQWLKLHDRNHEYIERVDKYEVKKYVANRIGDEYIIPTYGVWNSFNDIDFDSLPNQFVMKCTHDSGGVVICKDKGNFDYKTAKTKIEHGLNRNLFYWGREWPYKAVKPRIICEKYLIDDSGIELKDYKIMCFNGVAKCILVVLNRFSTNGANIDFYDLYWNKIPIQLHYPNSNEKTERPKSLSAMIKSAEELSKGIPFVRIDFYEVNNKPLFGEITFYSTSGFSKYTPESFDELLGSWIDLSGIKRSE